MVSVVCLCVFVCVCVTPTNKKQAIWTEIYALSLLTVFSAFFLHRFFPVLPVVCSVQLCVSVAVCSVAILANQNKYKPYKA